MKRGELAHQAGVNPETIRYYEKEGVLPRPERSASGYRIYSRDDVVRLRFITRAQGLGFTLREIGELLELRADSECVCEEVRERAQDKLTQVQERIRSLQEIQRALAKLIADCEEGGTSGDCPILETLEKEDGDGN